MKKKILLVFLSVVLTLTTLTGCQGGSASDTSTSANENGNGTGTEVEENNKTVTKLYLYKYYDITTGDIVMEVEMSNDEKGRMISNKTTYAEYSTSVIRTYVYEEKDDVVIRTALDDDGEKKTYDVMEYNEDGKVLSSKTYNMDDELVSESMNEWKDDVQIKFTNIVYLDNGDIFSKIVRDYDDRGNVIKEVNSSAASESTIIYTYEYDEDGLIKKEEKTRTSDGQQKIENYEYTYTFDDNGRVIEIYKNGVIAEKKQYSEDGKIIFKQVYTNGALDNECTYEYY